jgi:DNA-binding NarL/FixJ family response regulator
MPASDVITRVVIIGGSRAYHQTFDDLLGREPALALVGSAERPEDGPALVHRTRPTVIVVHLDALADYPVLEKVRRSAAAARMVIVGAESPSALSLCASVGAVGYLPSATTIADLASAVKRVAHGEFICPPSIVERLLEAVSHRARTPLNVLAEELTRREREVADLMIVGLSNREIARRLCIEVATVKSHVHSILTKLGVARRSEATALLLGASGGLIVRDLRTHRT